MCFLMKFLSELCVHVSDFCTLTTAVMTPGSATAQFLVKYSLTDSLEAMASNISNYAIWRQY